ncbi:Senescence regulator [Senna tora]|uniref:Senescence regulator n=1 Tax=Senna tora TaxID=362788 RepID=A0A834SGQ3_9FABA|nr:Senescence regulator [Senna tora]
MAEEFQESDVIFSDHHHHFDDDDDDDDDDDSCCFDGGYTRQIVLPQHNSRGMRSCSKSSKSSSNSSRRRSTKMSNSLPLNIPESILRCIDSDEEQLEEEWDDEGMVPPHVIVGRRIAGKMAFSVCTGNGRTLKGRDLSRVRNSILRMTGFLET